MVKTRVVLSSKLAVSEKVLGAKPTPWADHAVKLRQAALHYRNGAARANLDLCLKFIANGRFEEAAKEAGEILRVDPQCVVAWRLIGLASEGQGDAISALEAYKAAHAIDPNSIEVLTDLGRLAVSLGINQVAVELAARALAAQPDSVLLTTQLSMALRDTHEYKLAIQVIREAVMVAPSNAALWNALATVLLQQGDTGNALTMVDEALRLWPGWTEALYNRAIAKLELGDLSGAKADCDAAMARAMASEKPGIRFVRAQAKLAAGDLSGGWADYATRLHPNFAKSPTFDLPGRRWRMSDKLSGVRLLVVGEQGLGDEIMFASMVPDLLSSLGPSGQLVLAVEPRLKTLFQRSFPRARVQSYEVRSDRGRLIVTTPGVMDIDFWAPIGSLAQRFRSTVGAFDGQAPYLRADPEEATRWRDILNDLGPLPKVGLAWKSKKTYGHRLKQYAPFESWAPVLRTPGVTLVNLQYGDCMEEMQTVRALGVDIWAAPDLDIAYNIDGAAALSSVVDLVIGVGNASTNLAAAMGVPTWFICGPVAWPTVGMRRHPWFPCTDIFAARRFGEWAPVMQALASALSGEAGRGYGAI